MKKYTMQLLLVAFLLMAFQSFSQEKRQYKPKYEKTLKLQAQEKEIQRFISENLDGYKLTPEKEALVRKNFTKEVKNDNYTEDPDLDNLLLKIKKNELRELYIQQQISVNRRTGMNDEPMPEPVIGYICDNGGFEDVTITDLIMNGYSFARGNVQDYDVVFDCETLFSNSMTTIPTLPVVNPAYFYDEIILVNNDNSIFEGYDGILYESGDLVTRVSAGNGAIKLNGSVGGDVLSIARMRKRFIVGSDVVSYDFSLIFGDNFNDYDADLNARFIARLIDENGIVVASNCIVANTNDTEMFYHGGSNLTGYSIYTGWRCGELSTELLEPDSEATLEFIITDYSNEHHLPSYDFGTAYIDNICNISCEDRDCQHYLELHGDVPSGTDEQQASDYINAYNTISSGATAIYHAGHYEDNILTGEIVLLPGDGTDTTGFECLNGSTGHFYIEPCDIGSPSFVARHAMPQTKGQEAKPTGSLQIFPNPANSELNIVSANISLKAIRLVSLDGKLVLERQLGADSNKNIKLDVNALSSGIYILTVETNDGTVTTHKIVRE
ncbi:T9SS type A sorting domain-containing protein [Flavobacterium sp. DGU11]|uniref:T9SS type A sorting domain-containing protein n=1 Tax=Flavobacterium arundinis TaxID=3139143 RepID=A0ABU9HY69_9FLAO